MWCFVCLDVKLLCLVCVCCFGGFLLLLLVLVCVCCVCLILRCSYRLCVAFGIIGYCLCCAMFACFWVVPCMCCLCRSPPPNVSVFVLLLVCLSCLNVFVVVSCWCLCCCVCRFKRMCFCVLVSFVVSIFVFYVLGGSCCANVFVCVFVLFSFEKLWFVCFLCVFFVLVRH